jgi:hypothetical protein
VFKAPVAVLRCCANDVGAAAKRQRCGEQGEKYGARHLNVVFKADYAFSTPFCEQSVKGSDEMCGKAPILLLDQYV